MLFRDWIKYLRGSGQMRTVENAVSAQMELTAVVARECRRNDGGQALLFNNVQGCTTPCVFNLYGSVRRMNYILSGGDGVFVVQRLRQLAPPVRGYHNFCASLAATSALRLLPWSEELRPGGGLHELPHIKFWPVDGGCYLSQAVVVSRSLAGDWVNYGVYRVQLYDDCSAAVNFLPGSDGERQLQEYVRAGQPMPVAIILGCDPALLFAAGYPLPPCCSEMQLANFINQDELAVTLSPAAKLPIPRHCEYVLEGRIAVDATRPDGPCANHQGFYTPSAQRPRFDLIQLWRRDDAIYPATLIGPPPGETGYFAAVYAQMTAELLCQDCPALLELVMPEQVYFSGCAIARVKTCADLAQTRSILLAHPLLQRLKLLVIVDEAVDVHQPLQVLWRVLGQDLSRICTNGEGRVVVDATAWVEQGRVRVEQMPVR